MISRFFSLPAALAFSIAALLSEVWRGFLDAMFVLPVDFSQETWLIAASFIFTALFALWAWLLVAAAGGSRKALSGLFLINLLVLLAIPISWLLFYCPAACRAQAGIFNLANTLNLLFGLLAMLSLGAQLLPSARRPSATRSSQPTGAAK